MKLPEKIKGFNKIRDAAIMLDWAKENSSTLQIAERFKLTQRRIEQILRANHQFVTIDREWEKKKRIHWLKSQLAKRGDTNVDAIQIQGQLRTEIEGDGNNVDASRHLHQTYVWLNHPSITNTVLPTALPDRNSQSSGEIQGS